MRGKPRAYKDLVRYAEVLTDLVKRQLPWRISNLRDKHRLTQAQLAAKAGLAVSTINQLERGTFNDIRFETIVKLAAFFEVSLDYMVGVDHAGLVRAIAITGRLCPECGRSDAHSVAECALEMMEHGRSNAFIAARHQLTLVMVEVILREQIRLTRDRAGRDGPKQCQG